VIERHCPAAGSGLPWPPAPAHATTARHSANNARLEAAELRRHRLIGVRSQTEMTD
jgi:hypothetical protein